jgi:protocatechuate 3,4-dioxygenase beta subunit
LTNSANSSPGFTAAGDDSGASVSMSRRVVLVATGGIAVHLAGCRADLPAAPPPGGIDLSGGFPGSGAGPNGSGGRPGTAAGGAGGSGSGAGGGGSAGSAGSAGGAGGSSGAAPDAGAGGATTVDGRSPSVDGQGSAADRGTDFAADARIEVGGPSGTDGGANATCPVTSDDELGPYYLPGTPERTVMAGPGDGQMMVVSGRVLDTRCRPLAGALLDIWSTNVRGEYSQSAQGFGRGKLHTDPDGAFRFETVLPGAYLGRPRHVHFIVEQPNHDRVTTQMYFKGERPDIESLAVTRSLVAGVWQCQFDIVLAGGVARAAPRSPVRGRARPLAPAGTMPRRRFWSVWLSGSRPV